MLRSLASEPEEVLPRNIELKANLESFTHAILRARELTAVSPEAERQLDTYFAVPEGRLKLRRRWVSREGLAVEELRGPPPPAAFDRPLRSELIQYQRADESRARKSDYLLLPLNPRARMGEVLALAVGIDVEVEKVRIVFRHEGVRIHVDEVRCLGTFLEFEAIVSEDCDEAVAARKVEDLVRHFGLEQRHVVRSSYRELVRAAEAS
jgi:adenylate cyclase class IV